jgi:hypothetical protein
MPQYAINSFEKGLNQSKDKQIIGIDEAFDLKNVNIDEGILKRINGFTKHSTATLGLPVDTLMKYYANNVGTVIAAASNKMYKLDASGTFTQIGTFSSSKFDFINYQSKDDELMIFCNGIDNVKKYDGTTFTDLVGAPKGKYVMLHKERLWISGVAAFPNTLYFSTAFDPDDWTAPTYPEEEVNQHGGEILIPTWDGGKIIGLANIFDDIIIFKDYNVFKIFGTYPGNYTMTQLFNTTNGHIIDKSIGAVNNKAFWLTNEGIFLFNGLDVANLSLRASKFFASINQAAISNAVATIYKNKYLLFVPINGSTYNNAVFEYDVDRNAITIHKGINASTVVSFNDLILFANSDGYVYKYDSGAKFDNVDIDSYWQTGDTVFGASNASKSLQYVYFTGLGEGYVRITCYTDKNPLGKSVDILMSSVPKVYKAKLRGKGRIFSFRFENLNGSYFELKQPQFIVDVDYD